MTVFGGPPVNSDVAAWQESGAGASGCAGQWTLCCLPGTHHIERYISIMPDCAKGDRLRCECLINTHGASNLSCDSVVRFVSNLAGNALCCLPGRTFLWSKQQPTVHCRGGAGNGGARRRAPPNASRRPYACRIANASCIVTAYAATAYLGARYSAMAFSRRPRPMEFC